MANAVENFLQTLKRNLEGDPYPGPASAGCVSGTYRVVKMQDPWQGEVLSCKYRIESRLGKGAMSSVYKAVQEPIGRVVALKIMRREFAQDNLLVKRFNREARIVSSLRHRNIMSIHDVGITETGQPFFVMEFLNGGKMYQKLMKRVHHYQKKKNNNHYRFTSIYSKR